MSFICKVCGPVANGEKQIRIPIKIRDVDYNLQIKSVYVNGESIKTVRITHGTEIVEEAPYCKKHVFEKIEPIKIGKLSRDQIIKTIVITKYSKEQEEEE
jgi:hypothetical protein